MNLWQHHLEIYVTTEENKFAQRVDRSRPDQERPVT
jgi:hypothetical protein